MTKETILPTAMDELPLPEKAFEWPRQAMREKNWTEAAKRWTVLRKSYPDHPATWFQGACTHIEAGELEQADALIAYTRQHFPNHPNNLTDASSLAMRQQDWNADRPLTLTNRLLHFRPPTMPK